MEKFGQYDINGLKEAVLKSQCWTDVCRSLKVTVCTFNFKRIQKLCSEHHISVSHFDVKKAFRRGKKVWIAEDVFVRDCDISRSQLRKVLIRLGFYNAECNECKNKDEWNNKPLVIEIDHINGNCRDNRKENLRWLCPNCHSQTETYRNSKVKSDCNE